MLVKAEWAIGAESVSRQDSGRMDGQTRGLLDGRACDGVRWVATLWV